MGHFHECVSLMDEYFTETDCNMSGNLFRWMMANVVKQKEKALRFKKET